jgi:coproporphyrinogen III oxidase
MAEVINDKITTYVGNDSLKVVTVHDGVISVMMVSCRPDEDVVYWFGGGPNDDRAPNVEFVINHNKDGYGITHNFKADGNFSWRSESYKTTKFWTDKVMNERIGQ